MFVLYACVLSNMNLSLREAHDRFFLEGYARLNVYSYDWHPFYSGLYIVGGDRYRTGCQDGEFAQDHRCSPHVLLGGTG
jgi:hypothetical protein